MNLGGNGVATVLQRLVDVGLAERTPAASLGKYRATQEGRDWIRSRSV